MALRLQFPSRARNHHHETASVALVDDGTRVIALYLESVRRPHQFRAIAAAALDRGKPLGSWLYTVAYRPLRRPDGDLVETWPLPLALGQALPRVPLSLSADCCVAVDLEAAYLDACRRRRVDEARG